MRRSGLLLLSVSALAACVTVRPPPPPPAAALPWAQRCLDLQRAGDWRLDGRVAAVIGDTGWQASLTWSQAAEVSELRLAGPLGVGAQVLRLSAAGLVVNGAPAGDAAVAALQAKLGFQLPLAPLRYWLLGVPQPGTPFILVRNADDRAEHLEQDGWSIAYDRYLAAAGDRLPQRLVLTRGDVRVRLIVDRWDFAQ